ncbi:MAG TPA: 3D domain-containing protein, partial [Chroococcidiopsis sp.]
QPLPTTPIPVPPPVTSGDDSDSLAEVVDYRVVVRARGRDELAQVRTLVPDAFLIAIRGRDYVQAGVFRDRTTAEQRRQQLRQADLNARVVTVLPDQSTTANRPPSRPTPPTNPTPNPTTNPITSATFNLPEPSPAALSRGQNLWATYYLVHQTNTSSNGYPLLDMSGRSLGVTLSHRDWCAAALQGTVLVRNRQQVNTYNFAGRGDSEQVDCSRFYPGLANIRDTNRVRFTSARGAYGDGVDGLALTPYRSIAVDRTQIPIGSVVYIPAARGQRITLPNGETVVHDGYFFAADVGHAVQGNHIDMFIGTAERNPFSFATSRDSDTFTAYIVNDFQIRQTLEAMHRTTSGMAVQ